VDKPSDKIIKLANFYQVAPPIFEGATLPEVSTRFAQRTAVAGPMSNRVAA
jgi:hypothetical protein